MPKTTTKKPTLKILDRVTRRRREQLPHELEAKLKQLQTMLAAAEQAGVISGQKMARIQCPGCGTLDLGVAWAKDTGWCVLCDTCSSMSPLNAINPPDPEDHEVGERQIVPVNRAKGSGSVN